MDSKMFKNKNVNYNELQNISLFNMDIKERNSVIFIQRTSLVKSVIHLF